MHNVLVRAPGAFATQVLPTGIESASGQNRRFGRAWVRSGLPLTADAFAAAGFGSDWPTVVVSLLAVACGFARSSRATPVGSAIAKSRSSHGRPGKSYLTATSGGWLGLISANATWTM